MIICVLQIDKIYEHIMPAWKKLFEEKKLWKLLNVQFSSQPLEGDVAPPGALSSDGELSNMIIIRKIKLLDHKKSLDKNVVFGPTD